MKTTQSEYWRKYLANSTPCLFPPTTTNARKQQQQQQVPINLSQHTSSIRQFCAQNAGFPLNLFQLTWAVVLSRYVASPPPSAPDVVFAYRENSAFDNTLVVEEESIYRLRFPLERSFAGLLRHNNSRPYPRHRAFQTGSVPATMGLAGYKGQRLFNTFLYLEPLMDGKVDRGDDDVADVTGPGFAPQTYSVQTDIARQYDLVVKIAVGDAQTSGSIVFSEGFLSDEAAWQLAETFREVLEAILADVDASTRNEPDLFHHRSQVGPWGRTPPSRHQDWCVHQVIAGRCAEKPAALAIV
ncbi:hypothetical protein FE257_010575 [Aspergillus nanangensis]|uniref:Condensation domain-containing protein n=1 Tax=Aspergillus nanangensis TaxID=2582783 RepID=A0AAD4GS01_ASPNN|nr:hypothetical protein FE257_010575 [Aspergillus nanangensis]